MVKNVYEWLMSLQCLLCRGLAGERKMAVLGHWGGDGGELSRLAKLFLTTSGPTGRLVGLGTLRLFVVLLFRSMIEIISKGFLSYPLRPPLTLSVSFLL